MAESNEGRAVPAPVLDLVIEGRRLVHRGAHHDASQDTDGGHNAKRVQEVVVGALAQLLVATVVGAGRGLLLLQREQGDGLSAEDNHATPDPDADEKAREGVARKRQGVAAILRIERAIQTSISAGGGGVLVP